MSIDVKLVNLRTTDDALRNKQHLRLDVVATPWGHLIQTEEIKGFQSRTILGYLGSLPTTLTDVGESGVTIIPEPTAAIAMEIVSTSVNDTAAGTGAQLIEVHGLDANWDEISEVKAMNGLTAVPLENTYIRINNIHTMQCGSGGVTAGIVKIQGAGGGTEYDRITTGGNMNLQAHWTVPRNHMAFVYDWSIGAAGKDCRAFLRAKADWDDRKLTQSYLVQDIAVFNNAHVPRTYTIPKIFPPKCDIKVSVQSLGAAGGNVSCSIEVYYVSLDNVPRTF